MGYSGRLWRTVISGSSLDGVETKKEITKANKLFMILVLSYPFFQYRCHTRKSLTAKDFSLFVTLITGLIQEIGNQNGKSRIDRMKNKQQQTVKK